MANFDELLSNINAASKGISGMATSLNETNRYSEGLVRNLSDLASMKGKGGTIWSIIGRLSSGTGLYDIQNRLRGLTVIFRFITQSEDERIKSIGKQNQLLEENAQSYADIVSSTKFLKELTNSSNSGLKEALTLTEQRNRLLVRQKGFAGFIAEQNALSTENIRKRLDIERKVIQATPGGLDSAKAQLRKPNIIGRELQVRKGGLLGSNETESFAIQIAGISDEFVKLNNVLVKEMDGRDAAIEGRKKLKEILENETETRNNLKEQIDNEKRVRYDSLRIQEENNRRKKAIEAEMDALDKSIAKTEPTQNKLAFERQQQLLKTEMLGIIANEQGLKERIENADDNINNFSHSIKLVTATIEKNEKQLTDNNSEFSKKQIESRQELVMQLKGEMTARGEVFKALKKEAKERGIVVKGDIGKVSAIRKKKENLTLEKFLDGALLPVTSLIDNIKVGLKTFFEKRNIAKHMMFLKTSLLVFAKVLYAVTLIGLLVYILHKSGFIDGVKKFIEDFKPLFVLYLEGLKLIFTGLVGIVVGVFNLLKALFGGGSFKDEVMPALTDILVGIGNLFLGILTATVGTLIMGLGSLVVGALYGVGESVLKAIYDTAESARGGISTGAAAFGAYKFAKFLIKKGTPAGRAITLAAFAFPAMKDVAMSGYDAIAGMADGGMIGKSGRYLVGERGPEIVNLPTGARVFNNQQTKGMLGGNTINVSVNGRVGASDAELDDLARKLGRKINLEMNRYNNSGYRA